MCRDVLAIIVPEILTAVSWPGQRQRSAGAFLNLPAVQVLEAYGPKRFAATLRNAGLPLILPPARNRTCR
jgi:hypothetical protein